MLLVGKRDEHDFRDWLATEAGFLAGLGRFEDDPVRLETFQRMFMCAKCRLRCVEKSRQIGFSWMFAGEAVARAHLRPRHSAVFVSYNLDDSKHKIEYARAFHDGLPLAYQKRLVVATKTELVFESNGAERRKSRIVSSPSRAPRGKKGDIYLDELAHQADGREIYSGSTALIARSKGQLTICSTPLGRRGIFWEIAQQQIRPFRGFARQRVPWWLCSFLVLGEDELDRARQQGELSDRGRAQMLRAAREAPKMATDDRIEQFGNQEIKLQRQALPIEQFGQEFELSYLDEATSFYPYEAILPCTSDQIELARDFSDIEPDGRLVAGYDVGRKGHSSALAILDMNERGWHKLRGLWRYRGIKFQAQKEELRRMMSTLPIDRLRIDETGLGMQLAEEMVDEYPQAEGIPFSAQSKTTMATDLKILMQRAMLGLPASRELVAEIHSIRRDISAKGAWLFHADEDEEGGHADGFWAIALACMKERGEVRQERPRVSVRIISV